MTIRLNAPATILVIAGVILLTWLLCRGCNNNPDSVAKKEFDSLMLAKQQGEKKSGIVIDSLVSVINKRGDKEDSLKKVANKLSDQLEVKSLTAKSLATQVQLYARYKDTVELLRAAPLLADEVIVLSEKLDEYKLSVRDLLASLDSTKGVTSLLILEKDNAYRDLNGRFDFLAASYSKQDYALTKATKKADKRLVIGPQLGTTFINGKADVYLGVGITYRIIRL